MILSHAKNFKSYTMIQNARFKNMGNMIDGVITNMEGLKDRSNTIVEEIKEILALSFLVVNVTDLFNYDVNEIRYALMNSQKSIYMSFLYPIKISRRQ